jgi:hypothetical protein
MLNILDGGAPNILRARACGQLTPADHAAFLARLEFLAHRYGKVRVLLDLADLGGFDPIAPNFRFESQQAQGHQGDPWYWACGVSWAWV